MKQIREILPSDCVIVGQSVWHDILWLGLERNQDYRTHIDIQRFFSAPMQQMIEINPYYKGKSSYIVFSLRHEVKYLCNIDIQVYIIIIIIHYPVVVVVLLLLIIIIL